MESQQRAKVQRRRCISNAQRRALRAWFFDNTDRQTPPGDVIFEKTHADASAWWNKTYGYYLNSSTVCEILSPKYAALDQCGDKHADNKSRDGRKRERRAKWEDLEEELHKWVQEHEATTGTTGISGSMLRDKATELWHQMPCYSGRLCPSWSEGWKARFRARYNIKKWKRSEPQSNNCFHNNIFISQSNRNTCRDTATACPSSTTLKVTHNYSHDLSDTLWGLTELAIEDYHAALEWLNEPSWPMDEASWASMDSSYKDTDHDYRSAYSDRDN